MVALLKPRTGQALGAAVCLGLLGFGLYVQYVLGEEPCPLCIFQRVAYLGLMVLFVAAALHVPGRAGAAVYAALQVLVAALGAAIAARHVWVQSLPPDKIPECGPGLAYMMDRLPFMQMLEKVLRGSGECANLGWSFLGLSMAGWSLVWFVALGMFAAALGVLARQAGMSGMSSRS
jgi:protein dithiol:quinone oxidoreductase